MQGRFEFVESFDDNLSSLDVPKVRNMEHLFHNSKHYTGKGLENWNVKNLARMEFMFIHVALFQW